MERKWIIVATAFLIGLGLVIIPGYLFFQGAGEDHTASTSERQAQPVTTMVDESGVYTAVDQEPRVKGGLSALHQTVQYPETAERRGIEGRVYIRAVVAPNGSVRDAEIIRGIGGGCDQEALRAVRTAELVPATVHGEPVPAYATVRIQFALGD
jgi:TonB family protein